MRCPKVEIDNYQQVYDYYGQHKQSRTVMKLACAASRRFFNPNVYYADGAKEQFEELIASGASLLIAANHLTKSDQFTLTASAGQSPLGRIAGQTRSLGKDELFRGAMRPFSDAMGGVPVFRAKNHDPAKVHDAGEYMIETMAGRMVNGSHALIFPEGTCNLEHPDTLLPLHSGLGRIALRAEELGATVGIVPMGIYYPDKIHRGQIRPDTKHANVYINSPITSLADTVAGITEQVREGLQVAVDRARTS